MRRSRMWHRASTGDLRDPPVDGGHDARLYASRASEGVRTCFEPA